MCSSPSVPLTSSTNAPKAVVFTTLPVNRSPTSASLVIASMRAMHASTRAPLGAYTWTVPSSSTLMSASNSSDRARIVSPPFPISAPIFSGSILICSIRGAKCDSCSRGPGIVSRILSRMNRRPGRA